MKTLAYLDCPTGIAGDMCLGALVHAGVPLAYLEAQLARLGMKDEFHLRAETVLRNQQVATQVHVDLLGSPPQLHSHSHDRSHDHKHNHSHGHRHEDSQSADRLPAYSHDGRHLPEIESLIAQANLPERVTAWSLAVFRLLAEAEAAVHGIPPEQVHFHEVGATDAIVDIVGTCLGLDWLEVDALVCSPLPTGGGTVRCEHGLLPVPAPAVLNMMASASMPVYSNGIERELVTPTGCAIAAALAQSFGSPPRFILQKVGLGAGGRDLPVPNILRLWIGSSDSLKSAQSDSARQLSVAAPQAEAKTPLTSTPGTEEIVALQTQLDDLSPQAIGYVFDRLFSVGAVDVFTQAVAMKKNRLGTLLTVLCPLPAVSACESLLFRETTTLGIRRSLQRRSVLVREIVKVATAYGEIAVKIARAQAGGAVLNAHPEYEDCARIARSRHLPWQQVHQAALAAAVEAGYST